MKYNSSTIILHLSLIDSIGPSVVERLLKHEHGNLADIYRFSASDFQNLFGYTHGTAQKLVEGLANNQILENELSLIERQKVSWLTILDDEYPLLLKNIHLPPTVLYWRGMLPETHNTLAIVGSREANGYAQQAIDQMVPVLVDYGWIIVSGGARGADTMAHQATLNAHGKTIAILGSGLMQLYPPSNKHLFEKIIEMEGALVSPFPLLMEPLPQNFPARNRVIAGMSRGCIVAQAAIKSGARITADFCLSQGREVFAIPGPIDDPLSAGCHSLIQQGAKLTTGVADVLAEFGQMIEKPIIYKEQAPARTYKSAVKPVIEDDNSIEGLIIRTCQNPCSVDELLELTDLPLIQMTKLLFDLQLKGRLTQNMAGLWEKQ